MKSANLFALLVGALLLPLLNTSAAESIPYGDFDLESGLTFLRGGVGVHADECGTDTTECFASYDLLTTIQGILHNSSDQIPNGWPVDPLKPCELLLFALRLNTYANTVYLTNLTGVVDSTLDAQLYQAALNNVTHFTTCLDKGMRRWIQIGTPEMEEMYQKLLVEDLQPHLERVWAKVAEVETRRAEYLEESRGEIVSLYAQGEYAQAVEIFTQFNNNSELISILDRASCG